MGKEAEFGTKMRLLHIMIAILDQPFTCTINELAERHGCSRDTVKKDFEVLQNAGFLLRYDARWRYAFAESKPYEQLKDLLHFSEEDQFLLEQAIDQIEGSGERIQKLKQKLASLYDYHRLGHSYLRKPYLTKVDLLFQAKKEKRQVVLLDYRSSNSERVSDRLVEPFHVSPPDDMLHTFDLDQNELRHFRISRFKRVELTDKSWEFENHHTIKLADPFRIVDSNQVMVHLRLGVSAYNELTERYPLTKSYLEEASEPDMFDFQCMVNHQFFGLTNFILGQYHQKVEVLQPESLLVHLREEVRKMKF